MRCSKCGSENPAGKKYCSECGVGLLMRCPRCKAENAPAAKFCGECGAPIDSSIGTPISATPPLQSPEVLGERRHLDCGAVRDLAWPDRDRRAARPRGMARDARRIPSSGRRGDHTRRRPRCEVPRRGRRNGLLRLASKRIDNDAECAARSGLAILDAIAKLNEQPGPAKLSARVGVDSGLVVIGKGAGNEAEVFGDVPNIAARVQAATELGTSCDHRRHRFAGRGAVRGRRPGALTTQRYRTAAAALRHHSAERSARSLSGGDRGWRADALRRTP